MGNQLRLVGSFAKMTGYSKMSRAILRTALLAGYDVQAVESDLRVRVDVDTDGRRAFHPHIPVPPIPLPDCQEEELRACQRVRLDDNAPTILLQTPWNLSAWSRYGGAPLLAITMTESNNLHPFWRHSIRCTDFAIAPSSHVFDTFRRVVPEVPSALMPLAVDERLWTPDEFVESVPRQPEFIFFSIFNVAERKNWRMLMTAFAEEFYSEGKEVGLLIKATGHTEDIVALAGCCQSMGAWVHVDGERRTDWMIGALYRNSNVYVQPSPEGFGLPYVEAALCGRPSVSLSMAGAADIVDETTGYLVPTHMDTIIGHMPQYYPRPKFPADPDGHLFAWCDIDNLRATLRRAYEEEKAGTNKGEAARERALAQFTPAVIAPRLREVVNLGIKAHAKAVVATVHPERPQWATCAGAWGDVFCVIGNIRAMMADKEIESIGVIWFGRDKSIAEWLKLQPWVRKVVSIVEKDQPEMTRIYGYLSQSKPAHGRAKFMEILAPIAPHIEQRDIAFTQLCLAEPREPQYWRGPVLPQDALDWADKIVSAIGKPFLLLNPLSVASNLMTDHWPYWSHALTWVFDKARCPIVMVGENMIDWPAHPQLMNVSGQSRTMMDVLALATRSAGIITTSNNLAHFAVIADIPTVCVAARTFGRDSFYHRYNEVEPLTIVNFENPFGDFKWAVSERFSHFLQSEETPADRLTETEYYGLGRA